MGNSIVLLPKANRDILKILLWYNTKQKGLGVRFYKDLRQALNEIEQDPQLFQK